MYCKYCGKKVLEDDKFCKNCGEKINIIVEANEIDYSYAEFTNRLAAYLIDGIIIYSASFVIGFFIGLTLGILQLSEIANTGFLNIFYRILGIVITWLYFALMESSSKQATIGKMVLGIKVVDLDGNRISFARATGRYFSKMLSYMICFVGFFMAAFTEKKQALHDIIAGTLVVKEQKKRP